MTESVWVTTTTLPDGTFDIFQFTVWLQSATLPDLYIGLAQANTLAIAYNERWRLSFGTAKDAAGQKADFYYNLYHLIDNTIIDRTNAALAPQYPN